MVRRSLAVFGVCALALAGCGGGTKTVTVATSTSSSSSGPRTATVSTNPVSVCTYNADGSISSCSGASATDTASSPSTTDTNASSPPGPLSLGQSATFVGGQIVGEGAGEQVSVTVQRVIDPVTSGIVTLGVAAPPPPAGVRYLEVELRLQSTGTAPYSDSPGMETSLISKSTNGSVGQNMPGTTGPGQCATDLSTGVNIAPGQTESGCLFFQVPVDQQIGSVQYQTQGGGAGYQATWTLP